MLFIIGNTKQWIILKSVITQWQCTQAVASMKGIIFPCSCIHYDGFNVADVIVTIFPTFYFVHSANPVHGTAGHLMAGKLLIWDTTVCWTAATECYCSISLNRTKELETNLCEDLTITEKAPKYTNEAISWHWKLCGGLLQALPFSTISITGVFTVFFAHQMVAIKSALEWGMESG